MNPDQKRALYRTMRLVRRFEEAAEERYVEGKIGGFLHLCIGEEATAVGSVAALTEEDHVVTHYRDHGHALARGLDPKALMAELYGRSTGVSRGKGGSMHLADVGRRFWGGYAVVGGHMPLAVGLAFALHYQKKPEVVLNIFGDGSTNIGTFFESLNLAALWSLPVVFLIENNLYGMGTHVARASALEEIYQKGCAFGIPGQRVDGMDVLEVHGAVSAAVERAREGEGPTILEAMTYRYRGHSMGDPQRYREKEEVESWKEKDCIARFERALIDEGVLDPEDVEAIGSEVEEQVQEAVRFAEESPRPPDEALFQHIYAQPLEGAGG